MFHNAENMEKGDVPSPTIVVLMLSLLGATAFFLFRETGMWTAMTVTCLIAESMVMAYLRKIYRRLITNTYKITQELKSENEHLKEELRAIKIHMGVN